MDNKEKYMIYVFILAIFAFLSGAEFVSDNGFNEDYMGKNITTSVNGIFVVLVFMAHMGGYIKFQPYDIVWREFRVFLDQLIVVSFLFYSGYGMMKSFMKRGKPYIKSIFRKRFLKILFHFDIAVTVFYIVDLLIGKNIPVKEYMKALTTWTSIGNSNWYITAVLCMYILMIISFTLSNNKVVSLSIMTILSVFLVELFIKVERPEYCYNTLMVFPFGMWYAFFKDDIDRILMKNNTVYISAMFVATFLFAWGYKNVDRIYFYRLWSCSFMVIILLVTMKVRIGNSFINTMGKHVFSIYILQRIPMMVFARYGFNENNLVFFGLTFSSTIVLAYLFDKIMGKIDRKLFM